MSVQGLKDALQLKVDDVVVSDELCLQVSSQAEAVARYVVQIMDQR